MEYSKGNIKLINADCMEVMAKYPYKYFDLAIVDPPYGISIHNQPPNLNKISKNRRQSYVEMYDNDWDKNSPSIEYFNELFRISKNQIIWGGNYFCKMLPIKKGWIYWDKMTDGFVSSYSSGELAWTSFDNVMRQVRYKYQGNYEGFENKIILRSNNPLLAKIHPTQKPVNLYQWLLKKYATINDKIIDTHLGSASIAVAVDKVNALDRLNIEFIGIEIDRKYFENSIKRFELETLQMAFNY